MPENNSDNVDAEEPTLPARRSLLERVGRAILPILNELNPRTGRSSRWTLIVIVIVYFLAQEFIKWYTRTFMGG